MINIPTPPPIPYPIQRKKSYWTKIVMLGMQCVVLMIGAMIIWSMVYSRNERSENVAEQIAAEWGSNVCISRARLPVRSLTVPERYVRRHSTATRR